MHPTPVQKPGSPTPRLSPALTVEPCQWWGKFLHCWHLKLAFPPSDVWKKPPYLIWKHGWKHCTGAFVSLVYDSEIHCQILLQGQMCSLPCRELPLSPSWVGLCTDHRGGFTATAPWGWPARGSRWPAWQTHFSCLILLLSSLFHRCESLINFSHAKFSLTEHKLGHLVWSSKLSTDSSHPWAVSASLLSVAWNLIALAQS